MLKLKELTDIEELGKIKHELLRFEFLGQITAKKTNFPIYSFSIGSQDPKAPTLGIFAGVHGLERVGTHVNIAFLKHLLDRLHWDQHFNDFLKKFRIVSIPLINPGGMAMIRRSNPNGVDLMRNAPTKADNTKAWELYSGQRKFPHFFWYQGEENVLEDENKILIDFLKREVLSSQFAMTLDLHSGFGLKDRLWYPYAKSRDEFPYQNIVDIFQSSLDHSNPYHIYHIEQQSDSYLINGDVWDFIFDIHFQDRDRGDKIFIPWTLELGSWLWVKKNPLQAFSVLGLFNPTKQHRFNRIMRRHILLFNHFYRFIANHKMFNF